VKNQFNDGFSAAEICTDDFPNMTSEAGIVSIPTIQLWYRSELKETIIGCVAQAVLMSAVEKVLEEAESLN